VRSLAFALAILLASAAAFAQDALRVCADPDNLPYSHENGSGFENRIAKLVADDLKLPLQYAWLPDRRGFVRKTMGAGLCDVIIGVPAGFERVTTTIPYYRSAYVIVERADSRVTPASYDDPALKKMRVGVQLVGNDLAATPPGHALAHAGVIEHTVGFPLAGDEPSGARMIRALAHGELDAAALWGPQAGWYAMHASVPLRWRMLPVPDGLPGQRFEFSIAMGVKRGDAALRDKLNEVLRGRASDIDMILAEYGVPRLPLEAQP
jgi:mxaJ protein